jgi:hypothetical protein
VTAALAGHVDRLDLPAEPGISPRAVRSVFRMMAKIAQDSGEFRYGLRGSKLATLTDYSLSVVRRAQRYLVEHGYLERVVVGGGRRLAGGSSSTSSLRRSRRDTTAVLSRHASPAVMTQPRSTAHGSPEGWTGRPRHPSLPRRWPSYGRHQSVTTAATVVSCPTGARSAHCADGMHREVGLTQATLRRERLSPVVLGAHLIEPASRGLIERLGECHGRSALLA